MGKIPLEDWLSGADAHRKQTGRPLITLAWAQSIDGSLTTQRGEAMIISSPESMRLTHHLRAAHDAIAVGIGTVLADDPRLTVRLVTGKDPQPVILDSHLAFPLKARLIQDERHPWIATVAPADPGKQALLEACGARILQLPPDPNHRVDLPTLLEFLASKGINSIMVEGGARLITSFLNCGLVDQVVITISPILVGGLRVVEGRLSTISKIRELGINLMGDDLIVWGVPVW